MKFTIKPLNVLTEIAVVVSAVLVVLAVSGVNPWILSALGAVLAKALIPLALAARKDDFSKLNIVTIITISTMMFIVPLLVAIGLFDGRFV